MWVYQQIWKNLKVYRIDLEKGNGMQIEVFNWKSWPTYCNNEKGTFRNATFRGKYNLHAIFNNHQHLVLFERFLLTNYFVLEHIACVFM